MPCCRYFSISHSIKSTYLLFQGAWINKSHQVYRKVANHTSPFTSLSNLEAQRIENLGIHWGLRHSGTGGDEGALRMELVSRWQHPDFSTGLYQHVHCQVGDTFCRWVCFDHASWWKKRGVGERNLHIDWAHFDRRNTARLWQMDWVSDPASATSCETLDK